MSAESHPLRQAFEADGFVRVPQFLSASELQETRDRIERYEREIVPQLESHRALYDVEDGQRRIKQMVDLDKADAYFAELLHGTKARSLAALLLGEPAQAQTAEFFDKGPRIGKPTPAHQDGYYFCLAPNHALTMWIGLDDFDVENGCMSYIRGSHRGGIQDHQASGVVGFSQGLPTTDYPRDKVVVASGRAGDCYIHHSVTIHMAGPNTSQRHRRSLGLIYYGESAKRDEAAWARYQASVARQRAQYAAGAMAT